jgi:Fe-S oxidoreductase
VQDHASLIRERFPRTIRRNAGYNLDLILQQMESAGARADSDAVVNEINLAHLVCGSEGTLAVILGATLRLFPLPRAKGLAVIGFGSLEEAIGAVVPILGTRPSAVELLDDTVLDLARANMEYRRYVDLLPGPASGDAKAVLYIEYFAERDPAEIRERFGALRALLPGIAAGARMAEYTDAAAMMSAWKLRKAGEPLLHGMPGERKPITFVEDNAVPVERLGEFVREFKRIVAAHGTRAAYWAHASVGVLHIRPFLDLRDEADRKHIAEIAVEVADVARSLGGVMSGEHGDGRVRGPLLERYYGPELMRAFRRIKAIFDPRNLLNPGNVVEPGPVASIVETLRVKPGPAFVDVRGVETFFDYSDQHGFRGAVEMCNGAGVCRKKSGGTMCPSYMATLDERHSTRGRGNALRLAITGQLWGDNAGGGVGSGPEWNDAGTIETLDLCLSCKACKAECPSNVDVARLKAEYAAQRYRAAGRAPLSARVFGHVRRLNQLGSLTPRLANWVNRRGLVRAVMNRVLGLAPGRSIPEFAKSLERRWDEDAPGAAGAPVVALFGDCFTMYNEPRIGLAARRVLEAFGYRVRLLNAGCCGRAMISTGLLPEAIATVDAALENLAGAARDPAVAAIVVCEPSCLSAIKDDWLQLRLRTGMELRKQVAAKSFLVEEFLEGAWVDHPRRPSFATTQGDRPVLLHGHCHQKALWGSETSAAALRRVFGSAVRVLDSGCCGMAGSFGYAAHRYAVSMKIGELSLFPAVREGVPGAAVVAPGTSCRHQIRDGTGVEALHPVELLAGALATSAG